MWKNLGEPSCKKVFVADEDDVTIAVGMDGFGGNDDRLWFVAEHDTAGAERVGAEAAIGVGQIDADFDGARFVVGFGADPTDRAFDFGLAVVIGRTEQDGLAERKVAGVFLADVENQPHPANIGDAENRAAGIDRLAGDDFAIDHDAIERRAQGEQVRRGGERGDRLSQRRWQAEELDLLSDLFSALAGEFIWIDRQAQIRKELLSRDQFDLRRLQGGFGLAKLLAGNRAAIGQRIEALDVSLLDAQLGDGREQVCLGMADVGGFDESENLALADSIA